MNFTRNHPSTIMEKGKKQYTKVITKLAYKTLQQEHSLSISHSVDTMNFTKYFTRNHACTPMQNVKNKMGQ